MRTVFIADAHLQDPADTNYRLLLRFLDSLAGNTATLFIMGDLFEFWLGYRSNPFPHYVPILDKLRELHAGGMEIVYFEGNHDFHMGPFFSEALNARVFPGPATMELEGKRFYLCHGDQINHRDYGYRILRFILHNRLTRSIIPLVPAAVAIAIAERMGKRSKRRHPERRQRWDYGEILREFAAARFREGYDAVVAGHFHLPLLETDGSGKTLLCPGDWLTHLTYGELVDGRLTLQAYR